MGKYLTNIDLVQNELQNARMQNLAVAPATPVSGQVYYDTALLKLRWYNGTTWIDATAAGGTVTAVTGTAPIASSGGATPVISIAPLVNADIASGAAIAYSKLNLTGSLVNADVAAGAAIVYSKLNLASSIVNADVAAGAAIAYSKLNLATSIVNADIAAGAAIAYSKLNLTGAILNADLAGSIAYSKLLAPTGTVSMGSQLVTNVLDPVSAQDAATKAYVDAAAAGLSVKAPVRAVATTAITLSGTQTIDGVAVVGGDRVLVTAQASAPTNGIYVVAAGAWARATDADTSAEMPSGTYVFVSEGTTNADSGWVLTTNAPITLGTTSLTFVQYSGAGQITAGAGLTKTGNTLDVVGTSNRITVAADAVDISTSYVGQATITTLGTITTGTWTATDIAVADGGTGASTAAGAKTNLGFMTRFAQDVGDNSATAIVVTHSLGTRDCTVQVYRTTTPWDQVECDVEMTSTTTVTLRFAVAPTTAQYRVVCVG